MPLPDSMPAKRAGAGTTRGLPSGVVPIVQTPFLNSLAVDLRSFERLTEDAIAAGAAGLIYPAVASEVDSLLMDERKDLLRRLMGGAKGRVPVIAGVSSDTMVETRRLAEHAAEMGAGGILIQPTKGAQESPETLIEYLQQVTTGIDRPVILQDLDWSGPGLPIETILRAAEAVPVVRGVKVETTPAGPKYTAIREASSLHVSGGWAVTQMIDGLSRGVDAFMPEASMVRFYRTIWDAFHAGDRVRATELFDRLAPILSFSNQHIDLSIQFFKLVLQRRGIFTTTVCRGITREFSSIETVDADRFAQEVVALHAALDTDRGSTDA